MELISREVIRLFKEWQPRLATNVSRFGNVLNELPTTESRPIGKWIDTPHGYKCSVCNEPSPYGIPKGFDKAFPYVSNYCPNCGAKMEEVE